MTTSQTTGFVKPSGCATIDKGTLAYFRNRNRRRLYNLVIREFKKSGLSQADLARRLDKNPDVVCRWLREPANWTVDTASDLLFAISGAEASYDPKYPLDQPSRNDTRPHWLIKERSDHRATIAVETRTRFSGYAKLEAVP